MTSAPSVLIADDNPTIRGLIRQICIPHTRSQIEVSDGDAAIAAYRETPSDVVVMDIDMPRMNGLEATKAILESDPSAKIVIVTQHSGEAFREAATEFGACAFLLKDQLHRLPALFLSDTFNLNP